MTKGNIPALDTASVHHSVTDLKLVGGVLREETGPERESLHKEELRRQELVSTHLQVDVIVALFDQFTLLVDAVNHGSLKCVEAHVHERQ